MKVLIVDHDPVTSASLLNYLTEMGFDARHAPDGITALGMAITDAWDALLLDVSLPGLDGLSLCRTLRQERRRDTPIMMLAAKDSLDDKLAAFAAGADDYVVKPFACSEVAARLSAIVKRAKGQVVPAVLQCGDVVLDPATMRVSRGGRPLKLTAKCFRLLRVLMEAPDRVRSHNDLEFTVWGAPLEDGRTLRTHMHALRRALTAGGEPDPIETVLGFGYKLQSNVPAETAEA